MRFFAFLVLPAFLLLASCESAPITEARVGESKHYQVARFEKLFNTRGALRDLVLVTRDFREEMALIEHITVLSSRAGKYASLDFVSFDRKHMGKDHVRHKIASFWPVDLDDDPENRALLYAEATAEFLILPLEGGEKGEPPAAAPGVLSLEVEIRIVERMRDGVIEVREAKLGEVGKGIALVLGAKKEDRPPLHWTQILEYYLAGRHSHAGKNPKAAAAYQRIIDTISHLRKGPEADDIFAEKFDLRNIDYTRDMADRKLTALK